MLRPGAVVVWLATLRKELMMTSSNGNIFRVTGPLCGGIHRSPVNSHHKGESRGALIFFYHRLNKRLSKQSWGWWFETPSCSLWFWHHRNIGWDLSNVWHLLCVIKAYVSLWKQLDKDAFLNNAYIGWEHCMKWHKLHPDVHKPNADSRESPRWRQMSFYPIGTRTSATTTIPFFVCITDLLAHRDRDSMAPILMSILSNAHPYRVRTYYNSYIIGFTMGKHTTVTTNTFLLGPNGQIWIESYTERVAHVRKFDMWYD